MTICEEFLWGITTVGDGKRLRKALGLYGSSGFLTIPAWWLSLTLCVSLYKHLNFNLSLLSNRYELLSILLNCPCVRVAPEGHADRHAISHEDWAAWCDLGVCEAWTRLLYLVVMMNSHLLISVEDPLHPLLLCFKCEECLLAESSGWRWIRRAGHYFRF